MLTFLRNLVTRAFATNNDTRDDETTEEIHEPHSPTDLTDSEPEETHDEPHSPIDLTGDMHELHTPNDFELLTVRSFLLRFLPVELANAILDAAEYWPVVAEETHTAIHVVANFSTDNNAGSYCLITPPVPFKVRDCDVVPRIRCIKFKLVSNDQGWGGESRYQGTYEAAFSWFEASIIRSLQIPPADIMNAGVLNDLSSSGEVRNTADDAMEQRWLLQKNVHVSSIRRTHDVVWYHGDVIDEALASSRGCGSGRGFVEALVAGDRVAVVARAQYPGWANYVWGVKVEIFYMI